MNTEQLLEKLKELGCSLSVDDNQLRVRAPSNALTKEIKQAIREHKQALIEALPYKVIDYDPAKLYGVLPKHYQRLEDGTIRAIYRTRQEFTDHVIAAAWTKEEFERAETLQDAAIALGGVMTPEQGRFEFLQD